jgi:predicted phosphodiesterase
MRILHLSDLHMGAHAASEQTMLVNAMLVDVAELHCDKKFDLVVFTGDLAGTGEPDEFRQATELLLDPLCERLELARDRVVLVPGNHDIDRNSIFGLLEPGLLGMSSTLDVDRLVSTPAEMQQAIERLKNWNEFREWFYLDFPLQNLNELAAVRKIEIAGNSVGIALLNSAWRATGKGDDADRGKLLIGETQSTEALNLIDQCDVRLVCFHHPLEWLAPWNHTVIREELERRGTLVLSGHEHHADPVLQNSVRGSALYGWTGCLYQGRDLYNGYSVIDLNVSDREVCVHLRSWYGSRGAFDQDIARAKDGVFRERLPTRAGTSLVAMPKYTMVTSSLATIAQENSMFSGILTIEDPISVSEVLVEPRLYPAPYAQIAALASYAKSKKRSAGRIDLVDPVSVWSRGRVLIVTGESESGVSGSLVWAINAQFERHADRVPIFIRYEPTSGKAPFEMPIRNAARGMGVVISSELPTPALVVAIDDVHSRNERALRRLAEHIRDHPDDLFVLGCHGDEHVAISKALSNLDIVNSIAHVGPLGRQQARKMMDLANEAGLSASVDHILQVALGEQLPRSPFVLSALATVLATSPTEEPPNVSTLLYAVIDYLLGRGVLSNREAGLDSRGREHLLGAFAGHFVRTEVRRLPRADAEEFVGGYFRAKGIERSASPGNVLNALINRRILMEDVDGVGFRHASLLHVLAASYMLDDAEFDALIRSDPIQYWDVTRHAAGLRRTDGELLKLVGDATRPATSEIIGRSRPAFDRVVGPSAGPLDGEDLERLIADVRPKPDIEAEKDRDDYQDYREMVDAAPPEWELPDDTLEAFASIALLSTVLSGSELVDDVDLKTELTKEALMSWASLAEEMSQLTLGWDYLREVFDEWFPEFEEADRDRVWDLFKRFSVMMSTAMTMASTLGSSGLAASVRRLGNDAEITSSATYSLYLSFLFTELQLTGYPQQLKAVFERHRSNPVIADVVRTMALARYVSPATPDRDAAVLLDFLSEALGTGATGRDAVQTRSREKSALMTKLRAERSRHRGDAIGADIIEAILELEEPL